MPPSNKKFKAAPPQHPVDATGLLQAAKIGDWSAFRDALTQHQDLLSFENINELPPGRSFGVIHQIAYHGNTDSLRFLLDHHPRVDLKLCTKDGRTALEVATDEDEGIDDGVAPEGFIQYLKERLLIQAHHELLNKARAGAWDDFFRQLEEEINHDDNEISTPRPVTVDTFNTIPPGRSWGVIHQICFFGDSSALQRLLHRFPTLNLELETNEIEAPQLPIDIAIGRGNTGEFLTKLRQEIQEQQQQQQQAAAAAAGGDDDDQKPAAASSLVTAPSSSMKAPVPANGKLCNICYMDEHDKDQLAVACDNNHYICQTCFSSWVSSESDIDSNPQNILLNGGRITCVCKKTDDNCDSLAFGNKLIATIVPDEIYEKYLRARDFVVGKEAVATALSKINNDQADDMDAIEQEQIRNMYRTKDGSSYSAYMCGQCNFGPIDHGWCSNLSSHHGEQKKKSFGHTGVAVVNNSCPKCGWFSNCISAWPRWDGKFQKASQTKTSSKFAQKPVSSMTVPMLKAALKLRGASCQGSKAALAARLQHLYDQAKY